MASSATSTIGIKRSGSDQRTSSICLPPIACIFGERVDPSSFRLPAYRLGSAEPVDDHARHGHAREHGSKAKVPIRIVDRGRNDRRNPDARRRTYVREAETPEGYSE